MNSFPAHEVDTLLKEADTDLHHELVVFNDDVNTFEHVIDTLIDICDHDLHQAEQCTWIIHYKGKCSVKKGELQKLVAMCKSILDRGINATVN